MAKYKPKLTDLVILEWRDSYADHGQATLGKHDEDCRWISCGWVVRLTETFITVAMGTQVAGNENEVPQFDNLLSVPHTQIVSIEKVA